LITARARRHYDRRTDESNQSTVGKTRRFAAEAIPLHCGQWLIDELLEIKNNLDMIWQSVLLKMCFNLGIRSLLSFKIPCFRGNPPGKDPLWVVVFAVFA